MAVRTLHSDELLQAQDIFAAGLDTTRIRIDEGGRLPDWVGVIGAWLKRQPAPPTNAITLGNTSYFPRALTTDVGDIAWLMHELTHQWQYQHDGMRYLVEAILAPTYVYAASEETPDAALKRLSREGKTFRDFNREQQADIVRDYYIAGKQEPISQDLAAWDSYLQQIRQPPR